MKLLKCYIRSFGKLKDFTCDFSDGLNVFNHENGWGKTTLTEFLKAIFYGLDEGRKHSVDESERKKYYTWNTTEKIGGYVDFETKGQQFRLERYFGSKINLDELRLFDLKTGVEKFNTENLGERLFKVDKEGFSSTIFFGQNDLEVKNNATITNVLSKTVEGKGDNVKKAVESIKKSAKKFKADRGAGGLIDTTISAIAKLESEVASIKEALKTQKSVKEELDKDRALLQRKQNEYNSILKLKETADRQESIALQKRLFDEGTAKIKELELKKAQALTSLSGKPLSKETIDNLEKITNEYNSAEQAEKETTQKIYNLQLTQAQNTPNKSKMPFNLTLLILSIALVVAGVILFVVGFIPFGIIALVCGVGLLCVSLVLGKKQTSSIKQNNDSDEITSLVRLLEQYKEILEKCTEFLTDFYSAYNLGGLDFNNALYQIKNLNDNLNFIVLAIETERAKIVKYEGVDFSGKIYTEQDRISFSRKLTEISNEVSALQRAISENESKLTRYDEKILLLPEYEDKIALLKEELSKYKEEYEVLSLTAQYLTLADESLKTKYRKPLEDNLNSYLKLIDVDGEFTASVDVDLKVSIEVKGILRDTSYFSEGYKNLFNICERFALVDLMFAEAEKPFIVLDDPFANLDDEKITQALEFIKKLSTKFQILYMVCHESRVK